MSKRTQHGTSDTTTVTVAAAKGRPMLSWVGKRPLGAIVARAAQHVETFAPVFGTPTPILPPPPTNLAGGWPAAYSLGGLLFYGDNKEVLATLVKDFRGKVKLIYIDPPFDSGADYVRKVQLRGVANAGALAGEEQSLLEQVQYSDIWANDSYLQFMYERLLLLKELLSEDGSIYLHCDWHKSQYLRCLMDEVFGPDNLLNEVVWKRTSARSDSSTLNHIHDAIFLYSKGENPVFNRLFLPLDPEYIARYYSYKESDGRRYATIDATQAGLRNGQGERI